MTHEQRLKKMEEIMNLLNDGLTKADFEEAFKIVLDTIEKLGVKNSQEFDVIRSTVETLAAKLASENETDLAEVKKEVKKISDQMMKETMSNLNFLRDKVNSLRSGKDGRDGKDGVSIQGPAGKDAPIKTPQEVRDELETLEGDERLDKSAIKGIEQIEEQVKAIELRPARGVGGAKGIGLYVDGAKKLLTAQTINLIGGTNVTLSYNFTSGRNDITISATGGAGGGGILAATGLVNGSNAVYTFTSAPSQVIVDGVPKQKTQSDGTANWTGTTTITLAVAPNFDIYGIA